VDFLSVVVPLIALIIVLALLLWFGWRKWSLLHNKVKKEVRGVEQDLHKSFDVLRNSIQNHIKTLEKTKNRRELTSEEDRILTQLKRDLDKAERTIQGEMEKIEKDIR
jgi:predicted negative regulator of RcsB-dependent stress response